MGQDESGIERIMAEPRNGSPDLPDLGQDDLRGPLLEGGPGRDGLAASPTMNESVGEEFLGENDGRTRTF